MLEQSFAVFDGIGPKSRDAIGAAGISNWRQFLATDGVPGLSEKLQQSVKRQIREWSAARARKDAGFFATALPRSKHWLLFQEFAGDVRCLDIETTGLSPGYHDVTLVGVYDGTSYKALIRGRDLTAQSIHQALHGCKLLVTYYGTVFDAPFLCANFPSLRLDYPHFDLCFAGRKVGLAGGLKGVETQLGIRRPGAITEVDGFEAVRLWRRHEKGDPSALKTLLAYNQADTCNLAHIARTIYRRLCCNMRGSV